MKKVGHTRQDWLRKRDRRAHLRRMLAARRIRPKRRRRVPADTIIAPSYFCLINPENQFSEASADFYRFLAKIRAFDGSRLLVDLSTVTRMVANATLFFKAELSRLSDRNVQISGIAPRKTRTHQVVAQTGVGAMLGIPDPQAIDREDTIHWKHTSGQWQTAQPAKLANLLDRNVDAVSSSLYTGMIESVANCIEHAYEEHPERRFMKVDQDGWWGFQQVRDGVLSTCICDLGIGIANALPISLASEAGLLRKLLAAVWECKGRDVQSILAAIEYGRSTSGLAQRGKGLRDAHKVIDEAGEGTFHLASNRGYYFYRRNAGQSKPETGTRRLQGSISGTMYFWQYPLELPVKPDPLMGQGVVS